MFIVILFIIGKTWKQSKCPSTKEWIKKDVVDIYGIYMEDYQAIERDETMPFVAVWMDLGIIIVSEVSQMKTTII